MNDIVYMDDDLTIRQVVDNYTFEAPFRAMGNTEDCILRQKFRVLKVNYEGTKPAIGDAHPDEADYGFCFDENLTDIGGLVWEFTAVFAKIPTNFSRITGKYPYLFPAFVTGSSLTSRLAKTLTAGCRTQFDFARTANPLADLPIVQQQRFVLAGNPKLDAVDSNSQPAVTISTVPGIAFTIPSYETYNTWIDDATEFVAEAAVPEIWMGNIHWRRTFYIQAQ